MPYDKRSELPDAVRKLPAHAQDIYIKAFNSAFEQYDGDEGKAHGTAWAAVKMVYKQVDGKWIAKEAVHAHGEHICICTECKKEITVAENVKCNAQECPDCGFPMVAKEAGERRGAKESKMSKLSDENKREFLQSGLESQYGIAQSSPIPRYVYVESVFESDVIYNVDGQSYKASFTLDEDGQATFGDPEKVVRQTVYKSMEALQGHYSELIQEAGKRNAALDSERIRKAIELLQELLSSEAEPDAKTIKDATKEATSVLSWLKEQKVEKTEDGIKFPAEAYAYVPDKEKTSTWKLRLWEDPEKKITRAQLGRAAAALSPGGFRGQKIDIPSDALPAVKRKIRAEYRKLEVDEEEIPRWVKEAETRERVFNYVPLTEAKIDKGRAAVTIIRPGFNATSDRYYPAEMLKRDYKVFEGMKMFADHPTEAEDEARPERSISDWVATLVDVTVDESGVVSGIAEIIEPWLMQKLANLREKGMLSEMGISINAIGVASKATIEGKNTLVIEKLTGARSVDFVTEPGAGGLVTFYESDRRQDIDLVSVDELKEIRPDLVKSIETACRAITIREVKKNIMEEQEIQAMKTENETLTTENQTLKDKIAEAEKVQRIADAVALVKEAVDKAEGLPEAAKARILERFKEAESADGVAEAIQAEVDYIKELAESGKVIGLGPKKDTDPGPEKTKAALRESFKASNPEWTDEMVETAVAGR